MFRKSVILEVWVAPGVPETLAKGWGLRPPPFPEESDQIPPTGPGNRRFWGPGTATYLSVLRLPGLLPWGGTSRFIMGGYRRPLGWGAAAAQTFCGGFGKRQPPRRGVWRTEAPRMVRDRDLPQQSNLATHAVGRGRPGVAREWVYT